MESREPMQHDETSTEHLVRYVVGDLGADEAGRVEASVRRSPGLAEALAEVRRVVGTLAGDRSREAPAELVARAVALLGPPAAPGLGARVLEGLRVVARLVHDSWQPAAVAGFRGTARQRQLTYASDLGAIDLQLRAMPRSAAAWRLLGQLEHPAVPDAPVALLQSATGRECGRARTDERGLFSMTAGPGTYDLLVEMGPRTLVIERLDIG
jgi:anti-sigma factor RsiW